jgi:membrane-associated protease RseP (regulator of RpoE activity)
MAAAARSTAGFEYERSAPRAPSRDVFGVARTDEFRPLTPYLLGRNIVAGAEVVDLRPELAEYFNVAGGVLVVDVAPGTPAAISGILPGDVITRVDQVGVRSVEDLRFGVSQAGETLPITLIRRETSIQVLLRR